MAMEERADFPRNSEEEARLREWLDRIARSRVPADRDLWPALQARLFGSSPRTIRSHGIGRRWAWLTAGLALILALLGMASARTLWEAFFSTRSLERGGKLQALSLSQTRDGVTVTIERAYADANRIVIGYRAQGLPASSGSSWLSLLALEDPDGRPIPGLIEEGLVGASEPLGLSLPSGEIAGAASFDPWGLPGWLVHRPAVLSLRLRVAFYPVPSEDSISGALRIAIAPETGPMETPSPSHIEAPTPTPERYFIFDLTIPVEPEAEEYGPQTVSAQGLDLTLERWIWAPSGTRARVCFVPPDPRLNWTLRVEQTLETQEEVSPEAPSGEIPSGQAITGTTPILIGPSVRVGERKCQDVFFTHPSGFMRSRPSPVVVRVLELMGWSREAPGPMLEPVVRRPGPWEFLIPVTGR